MEGGRRRIVLLEVELHVLEYGIEKGTVYNRVDGIQVVNGCGVTLCF